MLRNASHSISNAIASVRTPAAAAMPSPVAPAGGAMNMPTVSVANTTSMTMQAERSLLAALANRSSGNPCRPLMVFDQPGRGAAASVVSVTWGWVIRRESLPDPRRALSPCQSQLRMEAWMRAIVYTQGPDSASDDAACEALFGPTTKRMLQLHRP